MERGVDTALQQNVNESHEISVEAALSAIPATVTAAVAQRQSARLPERPEAAFLSGVNLDQRSVSSNPDVLNYPVYRNSGSTASGTPVSYGQDPERQTPTSLSTIKLPPIPVLAPPQARLPQPPRFPQVLLPPVAVAGLAGPALVGRANWPAGGVPGTQLAQAGPAPGHQPPGHQPQRLGSAAGAAGAAKTVRVNEREVRLSAGGLSHDAEALRIDIISVKIRQLIVKYPQYNFPPLETLRIDRLRQYEIYHNNIVREVKIHRVQRKGRRWLLFGSYVAQTWLNWFVGMDVSGFFDLQVDDLREYDELLLDYGDQVVPYQSVQGVSSPVETILWNSAITLLVAGGVNWVIKWLQAASPIGLPVSQQNALNVSKILKRLVNDEDVLLATDDPTTKQLLDWFQQIEQHPLVVAFRSISNGGAAAPAAGAAAAPLFSTATPSASTTATPSSSARSTGSSSTSIPPTYNL